MEDHRDHDLEAEPKVTRLSPESAEGREFLEAMRQNATAMQAEIAQRRIELEQAQTVENREPIETHIRFLENRVAEIEEFIADVTPEEEERTETDAERRERVMGLLREAVARYKEDPSMDKIGILMEPDGPYMAGQIADIRGDAIVWNDGQAFPIEYIYDVETTDDPGEEVRFPEQPPNA